MLVQFSNFPDGSAVTAKISEEQQDLLMWLQEKGALVKDFTFDEVEVKYLC